MATWLRQSTAVDIALGPFVDSTDGVTAETALTISQADVRLKKNNGAWAQKNNASSATHEENGWYEVPLDTTDTNTLGILVVAVNETGALPVWREFLVVPANVYDSYLGSDKLDVNVAEWLGTAAATPTVAGVPEVDITHVLGTAAQGASGRMQVDVELWLGAAPNALISGRLDSSVGAMATDVLTAAALNADAVAEINATVDAALADIRLDELLAADSDIDGAAPPVVGSVFHELMSKSTGSFTFDQTTDSLEAVRDKQTDIETDTQDIQSRLPAALVGGRIDSSIGAVAAGAITAAAIATGAIDADAIAADAVTEIQSGLATAAAVADIDADIAILDTILDKLDSALELDGAVWRFTTNALEQAPTGGNPLDEVVEGVLTLREIVRILLAGIAGASPDPAGSGVRTYKSVDGSKNRIAATVISGNRSGIVLDGS